MQEYARLEENVKKTRKKRRFRRSRARQDSPSPLFCSSFATTVAISQRWTVWLIVMGASAIRGSQRRAPLERKHAQASEKDYAVELGHAMMRGLSHAKTPSRKGILNFASLRLCVSEGVSSQNFAAAPDHRLRCGGSGIWHHR